MHRKGSVGDTRVYTLAALEVQNSGSNCVGDFFLRGP